MLEALWDKEALSGGNDTQLAFHCNQATSCYHSASIAT